MRNSKHIKVVLHVLIREFLMLFRWLRAWLKHTVLRIRAMLFRFLLLSPPRSDYSLSIFVSTKDVQRKQKIHEISKKLPIQRHITRGGKKRERERPLIRNPVAGSTHQRADLPRHYFVSLRLEVLPRFESALVMQAWNSHKNVQSNKNKR